MEQVDVVDAVPAREQGRHHRKEVAAGPVAAGDRAVGEPFKIEPTDQRPGHEQGRIRDRPFVVEARLQRVENLRRLGVLAGRLGACWLALDTADVVAERDDGGGLAAGLQAEVVVASKVIDQ